MNVFLSSAWSDERTEGVEEQLRSTEGVTLACRWREHWRANAGAPDPFGSMTAAQQQRLLAENDEDVTRADVVVFLASETAREAIAEARFALSLGRVVVWVGEPRPLSSYRRGVVWTPSVAGAIAWVVTIASAGRDVERWLERFRGRLTELGVTPDLYPSSLVG